jgi:hypothetical protein
MVRFLAGATVPKGVVLARVKAGGEVVNEPGSGPRVGARHLPV